MKLGLLDRIAAHVGIWALRRIYGADCPTDVQDDWPDDPNVRCLGCDATRMVSDMRGLLDE
jgi:hypothetical protein